MSSFSMSPLDIKSLIVTPLPAQQVVKLSMVDRQAHGEFSSDLAFQKILFSKYPCLHDVREKTLRDIEPLFPGNFWKMASCFLDCDDEKSIEDQEKSIKIHHLVFKSLPQAHETLTIYAISKNNQRMLHEFDTHPLIVANAFEKILRERFTHLKKYVSAQIDLPILQQVLDILTNYVYVKETTINGLIKSESATITTDIKPLTLEDANCVKIQNLVNSTQSRSHIWDRGAHFWQQCRKQGDYAFYNDLLSFHHIITIRFEDLQKVSSELPNRVFSIPVDIILCHDKESLKIALSKCNALLSQALWISPHHLVTDPSSQDKVSALRKTINSTSYSTIIWQTLYDRCGQGIIQDSWAEFSFHLFLPKLKVILSTIMKEITNPCRPVFDPILNYAKKNP